MDTVLKQLLTEFVNPSAPLKLSSVLSLVKKYIERKLNTQLIPINDDNGMVVVTRADGTTVNGQMFIMHHTTGAIRFDIDKNGLIIGVDFWSPKEKTNTPTWSINTKKVSLVKILPKIIELIQHPQFGKIQVVTDNSINLNIAAAHTTPPPAVPPSKEDTINAKVGDKVQTNEGVYWVTNANETELLISEHYADTHRGIGKPISYARVNAISAEGLAKWQFCSIIGESYDYCLEFTTASLNEAKVSIAGVEYKSGYEAALDLLKQGKNYQDLIAVGLSNSVIYGAARATGRLEVIDVMRGKAEAIRTVDHGKSQEVLNADMWSNPKEIFKDLENLVKVVVHGTANSLLVTGDGGVGKTTTVLNVLQDAGLRKERDYVLVKGFTTTLGMYLTFFKHNGKIILFDDCDSVWKDPNSLNLMKGALESSDERELSYISSKSFKLDDYSDEEADELIESGKYPEKFMFTGKVIFISNMQKSKFDPAILSRAVAVVNIKLKPEDVIVRMEDILPKLMPEVSVKTKQNALDILKNNLTERKSDKPLNIRTLLNAIHIINTKELDNAEELILRYA